MRYVLIALFFPMSIFNAQELSYSGDHAWQQDSIQSQPSGRQFLRQADVMWAGRYWRFVDVRQKMNLPLISEMPSAARQIPLWKALKLAMENGIPAYRDDAFSEPLTPTEMSNIWLKTDTFMLASPEPPYLEKPTAISNPFDPISIRYFQLKEEWFFDRQRSQLDFRILGLGLVLLQTDPISGEQEGLANAFWMKFSDIEPILNSFQCYNPGNLASPMSYQDLFRNRMFHSMIYKKDNVFDRELADFAQGLDILLESEEIKKDLRNFEEDLWER
jgi:gliding motility associated protien GldN